MAHHLISIIGQIAMMMKKCIIVHSMTHTHSQRASQPASLLGCCIYPVKVRKTYKVFSHSGGFERWLNIVSDFFDVLQHIQFMNIVIEKLNWEKRLVFSQLKTTYITSDSKKNLDKPQ
jgi:hypothetical protein